MKVELYRTIAGNWCVRLHGPDDDPGPMFTIETSAEGFRTFTDEQRKRAAEAFSQALCEAHP